jgi:N-acetylglucosamine-6-phosphate deacetylase
VMSEALPRYGVTGFLPTVMTAPLEGMGAIAKRMARGIRQTGARAIGLYMEGPHLNCAYKGAQEEEYMVDPSMENWEIINGGHPETIKVFAMDPTRDGALDVARNLKGSLVLSCAHTPCDWQQAQDAFAAGFSHVTHLFNAMKPLHHRNPGLVGAALVNDAITCELIADLIHLHPDVLRLAVEMKGPDHICLITDAMMAAGMEDGEYTLGGQKVFVKNGEARLADGTLAGSTLTLNKAVYNMVKKVGFPLTTILPMVTSTPAREAGCADRMGLIAPGYEADLVLLNDDLDICATWVGGELKYQK